MYRPGLGRDATSPIVAAPPPRMASFVRLSHLFSLPARREARMRRLEKEMRRADEQTSIAVRWPRQHEPDLPPLIDRVSPQQLTSVRRRAGDDDHRRDRVVEALPSAIRSRSESGQLDRTRQSAKFEAAADSLARTTGTSMRRRTSRRSRQKIKPKPTNGEDDNLGDAWKMETA